MPRNKKIPDMIVEPWEPPTKNLKERKLGPLNPEQAKRELRALKELFNENDEITDADYERLRKDILDRMMSR